MSIDITGLQGYDPAVYDEMLTRYVKAGGTKEQLDFVLAMEVGLFHTSFEDAASQILSVLPKPTVTRGDVTSLTVLPSFGANYMAMITDVAAEQRRQNAQIKAMSTEEMIEQIKEQADTIRSKAWVQLITGIVTGVVSIAQGLTVLGMSVKGGIASDKAGQAAKNEVLQAKGFDPAAEGFDANAVPANVMAEANQAATQVMQTANMNLNNRISCVNSCMSGSNSILGGIGQFIATQYDAKLKEQEGNVERIRATQQMLDSLDENLKALIQKALASQDAIQQNMNQTRTRILG